MNVDLVNWRAVVAPPGLDDAERQQLLTTVDALAKSATWQSLLKERNWMDSYLAGDEFAAFLKEDRARVAGVLKSIDRKSVGYGKSGTGRVEHGGLRIIKKKNTIRKKRKRRVK